MSQNDSTYNLPLFVPYEARVEGPGGRSGFACESRTPSGRSECSVPPRDAARVSNRQLNSTNTEAESLMNQFTHLGIIYNYIAQVGDVCVSHTQVLSR